MTVRTNYIITCDDCGNQLEVETKIGLLTKDNAILYIKNKLKKKYDATFNCDTNKVVCGECKPLSKRSPKWAK